VASKKKFGLFLSSKLAPQCEFYTVVNFIRYVTGTSLVDLFHEEEQALESNLKMCSGVTASIGTGFSGSLSTSGAGRSTRPTHRTRTPPSSVRYSMRFVNGLRSGGGSRLLLRLQFSPSVVLIRMQLGQWIRRSGIRIQPGSTKTKIATVPPQKKK
jgi:hypothetical protein